MKRIAFVLPGFFVSGGVHIVVRWAQILGEAGHAVTLLVPDEQVGSDVPALFLPGPARFTVRGHAQALDEAYDIAIATWWETLRMLYLMRAPALAFFAQALEAQFCEPGDPRQAQYARLVRSGVHVITIAHWLRDYLITYFGVDPARVQTVLNPLSKAMWRPVPPLVPRTPGAGVRFLVEGSVGESRKNVAPLLRLLEEMGTELGDARPIEYLWVGARVDKSLVGRRCAGVLEKVPYASMPAVYSACDVLVKLSNAEGMFGPPLEMFATGGTAIAWDVWGAEEYMAHGYNALLVPMNSMPAVRRAVRELVEQPARLAALKENALRTAARWIDWDEQRPAILAAIEALTPTPATDLVREAVRDQLAEVRALQGHNPRAFYNPFDLRNYSARSFALAHLRDRPLLHKLGLGLERAAQVLRRVRRGRPGT